MAVSWDFDKLVFESFESIYSFDQSTDELLFAMDEIKTGSLTSASELVFGEGKQGTRLSVFDRNKTSGFTCTNGYVVASALASQYGGSVKNASATDMITVREVEYITVGATSGTVNTTVTLKYDPTDTSPKFIYKANRDMTQGEKYARVASSPDTDDFTISGRVITLPTGTAWTATDVIVVAYDRTVSVGKYIDNLAGKFPKEVKLVINIMASDPCNGGTKYLCQIIADKAKSNSNVNIEIGDNMAEHPLEFEFLANTCGTSKKYFRMALAE